MKPCLEHDLINSKSIVDKCKNSDEYSQSLYAAMCNNEFSKNGEIWSCSWRSAGGIVARIRGEGDYIDWYCSGIGAISAIEESVVTEEIRKDIEGFGWTIIVGEKLL
jgi:hypothetical protein